MTRVQTWIAISVAGLGLLSSSAVAQEGSQEAQPIDVWSEIDPRRVCTASIIWRLGITGSTTYNMVETVQALDERGQPVWRILHTSLDGLGEAPPDARASFDFYDLDRSTLRPLRSESRRANSEGQGQQISRFDYEDQVARRSDGRNELERIALSGVRPLPEGPGTAAIYQSIAWRDGLRLRGHVIDRWRGRGDERLRPIEMAVTGRGSVQIGARTVATWIVADAAVDGAYRAIVHVTQSVPHLVVRMEYSSRGGTPFVSQANAFAFDPACIGDRP